ncbi:CG5043, partial [Drosophila busckii]
MSNIPRSVYLTPSSSDTELSTNSQSAPKLAKLPAATPALSPLPPYLTLKRQQTAAILNFQARKSVSQMDFKEARRTGNYQLVAHLSSSKALVPAVNSKQEKQLTIKDDNLTKLLLQDAAQLCNDAARGNVHFLVNSEQDVRTASLRIFNSLLLRSWRRRRDEVRHLGDQIEEFKRSLVKNRNQLHVYNSLFAVEKRRSDVLNDQLKQSYVDSAKTKLSYNEMSALLEQSNKEKQQLVEESVQKQQEIENLQELLQLSKKDLFQANAQQRDQLEQLTRVQVESQNAKFDIEELTEQLQSLKLELAQRQQYVDKLRDNIIDIDKQLKDSSTKLLEHKSETELHIGKLMARSAKLELACKQKDEQLATLQNCLAATVGQRIRQCLAQREVYQHATFRLMHFVAYCMLPGTPPPLIPMPSLPDAVKKIRGIFNASGKESHNE